MKKTKKSKKKSVFAGIITTGIIIAGGVAGAFYYINKNKSDHNAEKNSSNIELSKGDKIKLGSWNIANLSNKSVPKNQYRLTAIKDIILANNLDILSIQELSYNETEPLEKIASVLGDNWDFKASPKDIYSKEIPSSKESYGIIYRIDKIKYIGNDGVYYGKDVKFTRPLWYSKWEILQDKQNFWIINGHLDAPGQSNTASVNESNSPVINNYKWTNQGNQEVKEYLDIKNVLNELKSAHPNDLIIFNGDTNIKKENFNQAREFYKKLGYETNYESNKYQQEYATSLGNNGYANPYDKIIAYDPNNTFEGDKFIKYDLYTFINDKNRVNYQNLYKQQYHATQTPSNEMLVKKVSDHTLVAGYINIKKA